MAAGRLSQRVRIDVPAGAKDTSGQPAPDTWTELCTVWACVEPVTATETWAADRSARPDASELVTVRYRQEIADAGPRVRLVVLTQGGRVLQAVGVGRHESEVWLTIPCKSAGKRV